MVGRVLLASIVAAVLMFVWGFVFWGLCSMVTKLAAPLPAELDVLAALRNSQAPSGMYIYPMPADPSDKEAQAECEKKFLEGPLLQLAYRKEGVLMMAPSMFAQGLGLNFAVALLTSCLLALAARGLPHFGGRLVFVLLVSLVAAIWTNVGDVVWWFHSPFYCLGNMAYVMGAGLVMGLVVATIVRRPAEQTDA
ncbi:MAG: hypothetical protein IH831_04500 [Planctomycetes bacterium]|nr:hypothetical protein [Planctomycetota bacterium]